MGPDSQTDSRNKLENPESLEAPSPSKECAGQNILNAILKMVYSAGMIPQQLLDQSSGDDGEMQGLKTDNFLNALIQQREH